MGPGVVLAGFLDARAAPFTSYIVCMAMILAAPEVAPCI